MDLYMILKSMRQKAARCAVFGPTGLLQLCFSLLAPEDDVFGREKSENAVKIGHSKSFLGGRAAAAAGGGGGGGGGGEKKGKLTG